MGLLWNIRMGTEIIVPVGLKLNFCVNNNWGWVGIMAVAVSLSHIFIDL